MKLNTIICTGVIATSAMTLYSYVLSAIRDKDFSEPETLGELVRKLVPIIKKKYTVITGWSAHYLVGIIFAICYIYLWEKKKIKPTVENGLLIGGISGLVAIAVWKTVIAMHPNPPARDYKRYYLQLLPAHLVFGVAASLAYSFYDRKWLSLIEHEQSSKM